MFVFLSLLTAAILVAVDQLTKFWAYSSLRLTDTIPLIENVLHFTYHENTGAAFSIMSGRTVLLAVVTGVVILGGIWCMVTRRIEGKLLNASVALIIAGGLGNLIDRVFRGFVVDFIDFRLINFPVFNFADICVVVGTGILMVYFLFIEGRSLSTQKKETGHE